MNTNRARLRRRTIAVAVSFAAVVAVLGFSGSPASADTAWTLLPSPVAVPSGLSTSATTSIDPSGNLFVAWNGNGQKSQASGVVTYRSGAWVSLGTPVTGTGSIGEVTFDASGSPIVTWVSGTTSYLSRWTGSSWQAVGPPLLNTMGISLLSASPLTVAYFYSSPTLPLVRQLVIVTLTNGAWQTVTTRVLPGYTTQFPVAFAMDGSNPVIAWQGLQPIGASNAWDLVVERYADGEWTRLGGVLNVNPSFGAQNISLAAGGGLIDVAWTETPYAGVHGVAATNYVDQWNGSTWQSLGGDLSPATPWDLVADDSGQPTVAFAVPDSTIAGGAEVADWDGSAWMPVGGPAIVGVSDDREDTRSFSLARSTTGFALAWTGLSTTPDLLNLIYQLHVSQIQLSGTTSTSTPTSAPTTTSTTTASTTTTTRPATTTTTSRPTTTTTTRPPTTTTTRRPTTTTTTRPPTTTTTRPPTTTTTVPTAPGQNVMPNAGFESAGTPADFWGGSVSRTAGAAHTGSYGLNQTLSATSGGWDLDADTTWQPPLITGQHYTATVWARTTQTAKVNLITGLMSSGHKYVSEADGPKVTLTANTWTQLTVTFTPTAKQAFASLQINFSGATKATTINYDDMSLTTP